MPFLVQLQNKMLLEKLFKNLSVIPCWDQLGKKCSSEIMKVNCKDNRKFILGLVLFQMRHVPTAVKIEIFHITLLQILHDKYRTEKGVPLLINYNTVNFKTIKIKNWQ